MTITLNLANLISVCGEITGRKKIQKIVHLLQVAKFRDQFPYAFGYLHFGPYSHGVKSDLDLLTRESLVKEVSASAGEHATFRYEPSPSLAEDLKSVGIEPSPEWSSLARRLNAMTPQRLEAASTVAFLRERGFDGEALRSRFKELKPFLDHDFDEALKILESLSDA